jgi:competence protein ComEA
MADWLERHRSSIFMALLNVGLVGATIAFLGRPDPPPLEILTPTPTSEVPLETGPAALPTEAPPPLRVYVSGAVATPDVYLLPRGSIVKDALGLAGGPLAGADLDRINLAQELADQQQIYIPRLEEVAPLPLISGGSTSATGQASAASNQININIASLEELDTLPGIGPAIAQRIIDFRQSDGPFTTVEQIMDVRGIGQATFEKMKDQITVAR